MPVGFAHSALAQGFLNMPALILIITYYILYIVFNAFICSIYYVVYTL